MKKIILYLFIISGLILTSCEETESPVYDDTTTDSTQILTYFDQTTATLEVIIDDIGSVSVPIGSSKRETNNRTVNISIVASASTADPNTYSFPSSIVIPANEYFTSLTIEGIDNGLETTPETLTLKLDSVDGGVVSTELLEVSILQICPLPENTYTGDYALEQITPNNPADAFPGMAPVQVFENQIITLTGEGTTRQFDAVFLEGLNIGQPPTTVSFGLVCNDVIVDSGIGTGLICAQGDPLITLGPGLVPSVYDPANDSVFELTLTEYEQGGAGCGTGPFQVTFRLTKQ